MNIFYLNIFESEAREINLTQISLTELNNFSWLILITPECWNFVNHFTEILNLTWNGFVKHLLRILYFLKHQSNLQVSLQWVSFIILIKKTPIVASGSICIRVPLCKKSIIFLRDALTLEKLIFTAARLRFLASNLRQTQVMTWILYYENAFKYVTPRVQKPDRRVLKDHLPIVSFLEKSVIVSIGRGFKNLSFLDSSYVATVKWQLTCCRRTEIMWVFLFQCAVSNPINLNSKQGKTTSEWKRKCVYMDAATLN